MDWRKWNLLVFDIDLQEYWCEGWQSSWSCFPGQKVKEGSICEKNKWTLSYRSSEHQQKNTSESHYLWNIILARQVRSYLEWSRVHIISSKLQKKGNSLKRQADNKINFNRKIRFFICVCSKSVSAINLERRFLSNSQIRLILRSQIKIPSKIVQWPKIQKDPKYVS